MSEMSKDHHTKTAPIALPGLGRLECIDPEVGELLAFHAEGRLDGAERQLFAAHLKACARCGEEERVMREVALGIASLRARPDPAASLALARATPRPRRTLLVAGMIGIAAALAVTLALWSRPRSADVAAADTRALEARIQHLEAQNAVLARTVATERARWESSPLVGIPIAAPPNL